MNKTE